MSDELFTAASGGLFSLRRLEIIADNLANVNTAGFKPQRLIQREQSFQDTLASTIPDQPARAARDIELNPGTVNVSSVTDFSPGAMQTTGNSLDVALQEANHFFIVQDETGQAYTRAGNFTLNAENALVTRDGRPVLGQGGPITIPQGEVKIQANGQIMVDGESVGALGVVAIENLQALERIEGTRFRDGGGAGATPVASPNLVPGALEMPNVEPVSEMVNMINAQKAFELYGKLVNTSEELTETRRRTAQGGGGA